MTPVNPDDPPAQTCPDRPTLQSGPRPTLGGVRIGTWNLQGRWDQRHYDQLDAMDCDLLLLTEMSERVELPLMAVHATAMLMAPRRRWSAVATRMPLSAMVDPHGASAMAQVDGLRVCSSILPWRSCGTRSPWAGATTAEKTASAVQAIEAARPHVWGGDWNHAMQGPEWSGSKAGRQHILNALDLLGLQVPTAQAPHRLDGLDTIDHIAVPRSWRVLAVERHPATSNGVQISDHDGYVIDVEQARE